MQTHIHKQPVWLPEPKRPRKMKSNIKTGLDKLTSVDLHALLSNVEEKMNGNTHFTAPAVTMVELAALLTKLDAAIKNATFGSRQSKLVRNAVVREVQSALRKQADYVRSVADGDAVILASSGFELVKPRVPVGPVGTSSKLVVRATNLRGELELRWDRVHGAYGYQVWMTDKDPEQGAAWTPLGYTTRASRLVTELESYKAYFFCVSAFGAAGEGAQCDPALGRAV